MHCNSTCMKPGFETYIGTTKRVPNHLCMAKFWFSCFLKGRKTRRFQGMCSPRVSPVVPVKPISAQNSSAVLGISTHYIPRIFCDMNLLRSNQSSMQSPVFKNLHQVPYLVQTPLSAPAKTRDIRFSIDTSFPCTYPRILKQCQFTVQFAVLLIAYYSS